MPQVLQTSTFSATAQAIASVVATKVASLGSAISESFKQISIANSRCAEIERMNNLTDHELATQYRINRDQIVPYVFRDKMI